VHFLGTCENERTAAQWRLLKKNVFCPQKKIGISHFAAVLFSQVPKKCIDLDFSLLYILILGTYSKFARKTISWRLAFAFRSPARVLAAGLPRQDHVYSTTDELFRFHNKKFDEMRCKLDSNENPRSFEKYSTSP